MKTLLAALTLGLVAMSAEAATGPLRCDCTKIAGTWASVDEESRVTRFVNIPGSCKGVKIHQLPEEKEDEGLIPDFVLCENGKYRMQYRFPDGYVDDEGTKAVYPLPPEIAAQLRGDVRRYGKNAITFGLDIIDDLCKPSTGKACESAKFNRVPQDQLLEE